MRVYLVACLVTAGIFGTSAKGFRSKKGPEHFSESNDCKETVFTGAFKGTDIKLMTVCNEEGVLAKIDYPELGCTGTWTYNKEPEDNDDGSMYIDVKEITSGNNDCANEESFPIKFMTDHGIALPGGEHLEPDGNTIATLSAEHTTAVELYPYSSYDAQLRRKTLEIPDCGDLGLGTLITTAAAIAGSAIGAVTCPPCAAIGGAIAAASTAGALVNDVACMSEDGDDNGLNRIIEELQRTMHFEIQEYALSSARSNLNVLMQFLSYEKKLRKGDCFDYGLKASMIADEVKTNVAKHSKNFGMESLPVVIALRAVALGMFHEEMCICQNNDPDCRGEKGEGESHFKRVIKDAQDDIEYFEAAYQKYKTAIDVKISKSKYDAFEIKEGGKCINERTEQHTPNVDRGQGAAIVRKCFRCQRFLCFSNLQGIKYCGTPVTTDIVGTNEQVKYFDQYFGGCPETSTKPSMKEIENKKKVHLANLYRDGYYFSEDFKYLKEYVAGLRSRDSHVCMDVVNDVANDAYHLVCGAPGSRECDDGKTQYGHPHERHPLRCCADEEIPGWVHKCSNVWGQSANLGGPDATYNGSGCYNEVTYTQALSICKEKGGRLCTKEELLGGCAKNSGCGFDYKLVWSSTPDVE